MRLYYRHMQTMLGQCRSQQLQIQLQQLLLAYLVPSCMPCLGEHMQRPNQQHYEQQVAFVLLESSHTGVTSSPLHSSLSHVCLFSMVGSADYISLDAYGRRVSHHSVEYDEILL